MLHASEHLNNLCLQRKEQREQISYLRPNSDGLQPNKNGLQPNLLPEALCDDWEDHRISGLFGSSTWPLY